MKTSLVYMLMRRANAGRRPGTGRRFRVVFFAVSGWLLSAEYAGATQTGTGGPESPQECALSHADRAYSIAADSAASRNLDRVQRSVALQIHLAEACIESAKLARPPSDVGAALTALSNNLQRLGRMLSSVALISRRAPTYDGMNDIAVLESIMAADAELARYPISRAAVAGAARAMDHFSDSLSSSARTDILRMHWDARFSMVQDEYVEVRRELDSLYARMPWRAAAVLSAYEGNVFGFGGVFRIWRYGREIVISPSLLASAGAGSGWGGELSVGIQSGDVAFLPGIVYLDSDGDKLGAMGSILLVRPGGLAMGVSVSSTWGIGFKTVIGF